MMEPTQTRPLKLWAGIECTVNRVGDEYFNQLVRNGHAHRLEDLDRIAALGIEALRYPVLWELIAPENLETADWAWPDERLPRLRELGVQPIAGLLHHGSGPRHTSLVDPEFPEKLAAFAGAVAQRYPWLEMYTPVNEPLTTARFSGLYGHWYPHGRDDLTFARCLLNECKGTILAMREIRKVNPDARLVQTDDLGKVYSTPFLQYQADLENERRWITFDLLCGRLKPGMLMWDWLLKTGITEVELRWFIDNPCPPDIIGINHYLTSDRYLDENEEAYPPEFRGGNGIHRYADEAAIRVNLDCYTGIRGHLQDVWERFHLPVAVTEVHLGCTREEQLRWLHDIWQAAEMVREQGADIRAITVWSLLGAFDWNCLVTKANGFYEPGVFDVRNGTPRPTAIARMMEGLAKEGEYHHPVLDIPGWWHRSDRYFYPERKTADCHARPLEIHTQDCEKTGACNVGSTRPILIIGKNGTLGKAFSRVCDIRAIPYYLLSRKDLNLCDVDNAHALIRHLKPWAVINAAGYVRVDDAELERDNCWRDNVTGPVNLAAACAEAGLPLINFSSDLVFCGKNKSPYVESDPVNPMNIYGESKAEAERQVMRIHPDSMMIRTSAFFGPWDKYNFVTQALRHLHAGKPFQAAEDMIVSPTYVPDLVNACLDLLIDGEHGIWHLSNHTALSWSELARLAAEHHGLPHGLVQAVPAEQLSFRASRPAYSALGTERQKLLPSLEDAMTRYCREAEIGELVV